MGSRGTTETATHAVAKAAVKLKTKVTKKAKDKKRGELRINANGVKGAPVAGKVTVTLKKGKVTKKANARIKKGRVVVTLPKLGRGKWNVTVR